MSAKTEILKYSASRPFSSATIADIKADLNVRLFAEKGDMPAFVDVKEDTLTEQQWRVQFVRVIKALEFCVGDETVLQRVRPFRERCHEYVGTVGDVTILAHQRPEEVVRLLFERPDFVSLVPQGVAATVAGCRAEAQKRGMGMWPLLLMGIAVEAFQIEDADRHTHFWVELLNSLTNDDRKEMKRLATLLVQAWESLGTAAASSRGSTTPRTKRVDIPVLIKVIAQKPLLPDEQEALARVFQTIDMWCELPLFAALPSEMQAKLCQARQSAADARQRADEELQRAAEERQRAAEERQRAAEERRRAAEERQIDSQELRIGTILDDMSSLLGRSSEVSFSLTERIKCGLKIQSLIDSLEQIPYATGVLARLIRETVETAVKHGVVKEEDLHVLRDVIGRAEARRSALKRPRSPTPVDAAAAVVAPGSDRSHTAYAAPGVLPPLTLALPLLPPTHTPAAAAISADAAVPPPDAWAVTFELKVGTLSDDNVAQAALELVAARVRDRGASSWRKLCVILVNGKQALVLRFREHEEGAAASADAAVTDQGNCIDVDCIKFSIDSCGVLLPKGGADADDDGSDCPGPKDVDVDVEWLNSQEGPATTVPAGRLATQESQSSSSGTPGPRGSGESSSAGSPSEAELMKLLNVTLAPTRTMRVS